MGFGAITPGWLEASFWPRRVARGKLASVTARAMVLCAGLGTRLRPLTFELPKPLVPVGDRSILAHAADRLRAAGFSELVINTHHLPDAFSNIGDSLGLDIHVVHEPEIRGTAGGVAGARRLLGPAPILLWNGDILATPPIGALIAAASAGGLALALVPRPRGEGTVGVDDRGQVVRLRGRVFGAEARGGDYSGVAALGHRCLEALPDVGCLVGDYAIPELERGGRVLAVPMDGGFADAGDPESYLALNLAWLEERGLEAWVAPTASVGSGVCLKRSIVGAGARVEGMGALESSVIWPGAIAEAPLEGAIVTPSGRVVLARRGAEPHSR